MTEPSPSSPTMAQKYGGWWAAVLMVLGYLGVEGPDKFKNWLKESDVVEERGRVGDEAIPGPDPSAQTVDLTDAQLESIVNRVVEKVVPLVNPPLPSPPLDPPPAEDLRPEIVVTDESGEVFAESEAPAGKLLMVTSSKKVPVGWAISKYGDVRVLLLPDNLGYAVSLQAGSSVEFFLTDASLKAVSLRVSCNQAPQPPPVVPDVKPVPPTPPEPGPGPRPAPPPNVEKTRVYLAVVEADVRKRSPETAKILASLDCWNEFREKGNDYRFYDSGTSEPKGKQAVADAGTLEKPVLVIYDKLTGTKLAALSLPTTRGALKELVAQYTGDLYTEEADVKH